MRNKILILLLILAISGLMIIGFSCIHKPQVKVGKIIGLAKPKIQNGNGREQYTATIILCNNQKVKTYILGHNVMQQRLEVNKIIKFELKRAGSKVIKRIVD